MPKAWVRQIVNNFLIKRVISLIENFRVDSTQQQQLLLGIEIECRKLINVLQADKNNVLQSIQDNLKEISKGIIHFSAIFEHIVNRPIIKV